MKCLKKVIPSMSSEVFEKGDHVRVWSLQSFHGGGSLEQMTRWSSIIESSQVSMDEQSILLGAEMHQLEAPVL